jgi:hypothetical protein
MMRDGFEMFLNRLYKSFSRRAVSTIAACWCPEAPPPPSLPSMTGTDNL